MRYLFLLLILACPFAFHYFPYKFQIPPSYLPVSFHPEWESSVTEEVQEILTQPFHYLTSGNQCHVFESQDGQYVIKLFRFKLSRFSFVHSIKTAIQKILGRKVRADLVSKANKTFSAAHIAATHAQECTQVVYSHLNLTDRIFPKSYFQTPYKSFYLPMDQFRFVIQKKGVPFTKKMAENLDHPQVMCQLIDSFIALIRTRLDKAVRNSDPKLESNFGFIGKKAIEMDFGNYRQLQKSSPLLQEEYLLRMNSLRYWLERHAPQYVSYFDHLNKVYHVP